jgi:hypothetical protein
MKRTAIFAFCLVFCIISGCAHTELTRRYKSKNFAAAPPGKEQTYVQVSAFVMKTPPPPQQTLLSQLHSEGQAALISKLAEKVNTPDELYQALAASEKGPGGTEGIIDKTVFKKRIVFSVEKESPGKGDDDLTPADRISALKVTLNFKDNKNIPVFADWNKFDTDWGTVDLGTLKRTQHTTAGGTLNVGPAIDVKVPVSGTANISTEKSIDETINLRQRFIKMNGAIKKNRQEAVLLQESQVGLDLAGNFSVDFTIDITNQKRSGFVIIGAFEKDGKPLKPDDIKIDFGSLIYPVSSKPVQCDLAGDYTIRHLRQLPLYDRYDRELAEGLHRVVFVSGSSTGDKVELISSKELRTSIYEIHLKGQNRPLYLGRQVTSELKDSDGNIKETIDKNPLRFLKFEDAKRFLIWLKESKPKVSKSASKGWKFAKIGKYMIYQDKDNPIKKEDIPNLHIRAKQLN